MISHRYRCIYVIVPKCASTSVRAWFFRDGAGRFSSPTPWQPGGRSHRIRWLANVTDLYPDYHSFTFLRNPYRRFVSAYLHARRDAKMRAARNPDQPVSYGTMLEFAELCGELLADTRGLWGTAFNALFLEKPDRRYGPSGIPLRDLHVVASTARPQVDFLPDCNPDRLFGVPRLSTRRLSFIGTVETIDTDFRHLQDLLDLPRRSLPRRNVGESASEAFEMLRNDRDARRLVEEIYAPDFAFTGCGFDDPPAPTRPAPENVPSAPAPRPSVTTRIRRGRFALASFALTLAVRHASATPVRIMLRLLAFVPWLRRPRRSG